MAVAVVTAPGSDIIDLGELTPESVSSKSGRRLPPIGATQRHLLIALILAALAVIPRGSVRGPAPLLGSPLWTMQVALPPAVLPDAVMAQPVNAGYLAAFDRRTGRELWRFDQPDPLPQQVTQLLPGGPMVAYFDDPDPNRLRSELVEPTRGRVLTTISGDLAGFAGDGSVVIFVELHTGGGCNLAPGLPPDPNAAPPRAGGGPPCQSVAGYDGRTGQRLWGFDTGANTSLTFERDLGDSLISSFSVTTTDGVFAVYDPVSGAVLWQGRTPPAIDASMQNRGGASILIRDRQFLVYFRADGTIVAEAYPRGAGTPVWRHEFAGATQINGGVSCGQYLCLFIADQLALLDIATGQQRASLGFDPSRFVTADTVLVMIPAGPNEAAVLWNLRTGRSTGQLPLDRIVASADLGRVLGLRRVGSGYTLYRVDPAGQLTALGHLAGSTTNPEDSQCLAQGDALACINSLNLMRVWRVPD